MIMSFFRQKQKLYTRRKIFTVKKPAKPETRETLKVNMVSIRAPKCKKSNTCKFFLFVLKRKKKLFDCFWLVFTTTVDSFVSHNESVGTGRCFRLILPAEALWSKNTESDSPGPETTLLRFVFWLSSSTIKIFLKRSDIIKKTVFLVLVCRKQIC